MERALESSLMKKEVKVLISMADRMHSELVRRLYATNDGRVRCCTCNKTLHWKFMTCGHYQPRRHGATRWLVKNAGPQCMECNGSEDGKIFKMSEWVDKEFGIGTSEEMIILAKTNHKQDKYFIIQSIITLTKQLNGLN